MGRVPVVSLLALWACIEARRTNTREALRLYLLSHVPDLFAIRRPLRGTTTFDRHHVSPWMAVTQGPRRQMFKDDYRRLTEEEQAQLGSALTTMKIWQEKIMKLEKARGENPLGENVTLEHLEEQLEQLLGQEEHSKYQADKARGSLASQILVSHNIRMAIWVANNYKQVDMAHDDLVSEGIQGLKVATETFDERVHRTFADLAFQLIRKHISDFVGDNIQMIKTPKSVYSINKKVREAKRVLGDDASPEAIAEEVGETEARIASVEKMQWNTRARSMETPIYTTKKGGSQVATMEANLYANVKDPGSEMESGGWDHMMENVLDGRLDPTEAHIIRLRHGLKRGAASPSFQEIAKAMNLTAVAARQIYIKGLVSLKTNGGDKDLAMAALSKQLETMI